MSIVLSEKQYRSSAFTKHSIDRTKHSSKSCHI